MKKLTFINPKTLITMGQICFDCRGGSMASFIEYQELRKNLKDKIS